MVIVYQTKKKKKRKSRKSKTDMSLTTCYDNKRKKKKIRKEFGATEAEASDIEERDKINVPATRLCATAAELVHSGPYYQNSTDMLQLQRAVIKAITSCKPAKWSRVWKRQFTKYIKN